MIDRTASAKAHALHWDSVYQRQQSNEVSWYEDEPTVSLELIDALGVENMTRIIDVGGGTSQLAGALVTRGFSDVSVLDVSAAALSVSQSRIGDTQHVKWIVHDLLTWEPRHAYDLWHDRAVFHFLNADDVTRYHHLLQYAVSPGGHVIMATFAPDGPTHCSGLSVTRYDVDHLRDFLGSEFRVLSSRRELHTTPNDALQPFTWIVAEKTAA